MATEGMQSQVSLLATAWALWIDHVTAEVIEALRARGIPSILLKGPSLAVWLYDDGAARGYEDADILVPPDCYQRAVAVLAELGFEELPPDVPVPDKGLPHAQPYGRSDGARVDLHMTLAGAMVAPQVAWRLLDVNTEALAVGGALVRVPNLPARALIVAFHAFQHGPQTPRPLADLERAIRRAPETTWRAAAALAAGLDASWPLAAGLRLVPAGAALADRLGLPGPEIIAAAMDPRSPAQLAIGFERLSRRRGLRAKLRLIAQEALPSPEFLRWWAPVARSKPLGLPLAYLQRLLWLARHAGPSLRLWWHARSR